MIPPKQPIMLEKARQKFLGLPQVNSLLDHPLMIQAEILSPEAAIGTPTRQDYPLLYGKERIIEAAFDGSRGQAFSSTPCAFSGTLLEVMHIPLTDDPKRAIFVAAVNAVLRHLGVVRETIHCKDNEPETCGLQIVRELQKESQGRIGLIGLNPAIAESLVRTFGAGQVMITDLSSQNVGTNKFGVDIWDGRYYTGKLIRDSSVVLITGTSLINNTFDEIWNLITPLSRDYRIFGITAAGFCALMDLKRICPFAQK